MAAADIVEAEADRLRIPIAIEKVTDHDSEGEGGKFFRAQLTRQT